MRFIDEPYCRVCYCAIRKVLHDSTGLDPATTWCLDQTPPAPITDLHRTAR